MPPVLALKRIDIRGGKTPRSFPMFKTQYPFKPLEVTDGDQALASIAFGWTLGFGYFTAIHAIRETRRARWALNTYIILIWGELIACLIFAIICWLYLYHVVPPSFMFFMSILTCWAIQVQLLLQIICNRLCFLLPTDRSRRRLRWSVAAAITLVNISVYCIWIPSKLQINDRYVWVNVWWDRIEKCIYLFVDAILNFMFIWTIKKRLVEYGQMKFEKLVKFNTQIVAVSLAMDCLIIGMMSLRNDFVYMQFHPVAYMVKLNIEMSMSDLMVKVARNTGVEVDGEPVHGSSRTYRERDFQHTTQGQTIEIQVHVTTTTQAIEEISLDHFDRVSEEADLEAQSATSRKSGADQVQHMYNSRATKS